MPEAYKDVKDVIGVVEAAGIGRAVARLRPLGVVKGQGRLRGGLGPWRVRGAS